MVDARRLQVFESGEQGASNAATYATEFAEGAVHAAAGIMAGDYRSCGFRVSLLKIYFLSTMLQ